MKIAIVPTIFVALGGTGATVLRHFRERLAQRVGTADLPYLRYLYVDTDTGALSAAMQGVSGRALSWTACNTISPAPDTLRRLQTSSGAEDKLKARLRLNRWFDQYALSQLNPVGFSQGVGGKRMFSRLAFLTSENLGALEQQLITFYNDLRALPEGAGKPLENVDPPYLSIIPSHVYRKVRFIVVSSAGGGTGSGSFIDLGFLLRKLAMDNAWDPNIVSQLGHLALARTDGPVMMQVRNSAGVLTELDYYDGETSYETSYITSGDKDKPFTVQTRPYDHVYVVQPTQSDRPLSGDSQQALDALLWRMAEFLLVSSIAAYVDAVPDGEIKLPSEGEISANAWRKDVESNPPGLMTFGVATREWPAALVHRSLYGSLLQDVADRWNETSTDAVRSAIVRFRSVAGLPDELVTANQTPRPSDGDRILSELMAPFNEFDPKAKLVQCSRRAFDQKGRYKPENLVEVGNALKEQFQQRHGPPIDGHPGIVYAVVTENARRLMNSENADSLRQSLTQTITELCRTGPATSAVFARQVEAELKAESAFISEVLDALKPAIQEHPSKLEQCWQYANDRLLELVLRNKLALYKDLLEWLQSLRIRLESFREYLQKWGQSLQVRQVPLASQAHATVFPEATTRRLRDVLKKGVEVDLSVLEKDVSDPLGRRRSGLLRELRRLMDEGLPEKDHNGQPTLFADSLPTYQGQTDFSYLQNLERAVFESIGNSQATPYNESVLALMADAEGSIPNLMVECEPLIKFRPDAEYTAKSFGFPGTLLTRVVQTNQSSYPALSALDDGGRTWHGSWRGGTQQLRELEAMKTTSEKLSPWSVTYWVERCSIDTKLIVGYDRESRRNLFSRDPFPAITDVRIKLPAEDKLKNRAERLLLGSVALDRWKVLGGGNGLRFEYTATKNGVPMPASWDVPEDFNAAVRSLANVPDVLDAIETKLMSWLQDKSGEGATLLKAAVDSILRAQDDGKNDNQKKHRGPVPSLHLLNVDYSPAIDALLYFASAFKIRLPEVSHPYAVFLLQDSPLKNRPNGKAPQDGWYCTRCGDVLGLHMPVREGRCENILDDGVECRNPFNSGTGDIRV